jgi:hypothetical protein
MEDQHGRIARDVIRAGTESGVLKGVSKAVRGPKRHFVRFNVDRDTLLNGQVYKTSDPSIEEFWQVVGRVHPFEPE